MRDALTHQKRGILRKGRKGSRRCPICATPITLDAVVAHVIAGRHPRTLRCPSHTTTLGSSTPRPESTG